ncbi:MAG: biotin/lipoyl-containing protein, partial [Baekduia sp.]
DREWLRSLAVPKPEQPDDEAETVTKDYVVEVGGKRFDVRVHGEAGANGAAPAAGKAAPKQRARKSASGNGGGDTLTSPLQGNVFKVLVEEGAEVQEGALVCIIEAMKMENEITAHKSGVIETLSITEGEPIQSGAQIAIIKSPPAAE